MAMERDQSCPVCGEDERYTRVASTILNMGLKTKWRCRECGYTTVQIGTEIDTATA